MKKLLIGIVSLLVLGAAGFGWYYLYGPCGVNVVRSSSQQLQAQMEEFQDALDVAVSTARFAVSGPIADMQDIRRATDDLAVPVCLSNAKALAVAGMEKSIKGMTDFSAQASDNAVASSMFAGEGYILDAAAELETVAACAPFCKADPYKRTP